MEGHGIPAQEIRFILEAKIDKVRKTLIAGMNEGSIRVLSGSTSMLDTGVNAQNVTLPSIIGHAVASFRLGAEGRTSRAQGQ